MGNLVICSCRDAAGEMHLAAVPRGGVFVRTEDMPLAMAMEAQESVWADQL